MILLEDTIKEIKKNSSVKEESAIDLAKREKQRLYYKQYILDNKQQLDKYKKEYRLNNREKQMLYLKQYRLDNKEFTVEYGKKYRFYNKEKIALAKKQKLSTDPLFRLICNYRNRINNAINGNSKSASTMKLLGCSIEFLKQHLEKQFKPGMSWENRSSFHVDHIRPCASFDLIKPEEQRKCFNYTNLQPLFPIDNMRKGARY